MTSTLQSDPRLEHVTPTTWEAIFETWRQSEALDPQWIAHFKSRGYASWEEWRQEFVDALHLPQYSWEIYHVINPSQSVPGFFGGPFKSWVDNQYDGEQMRQFSWLADLKYCQEHPKIQSLIKDFPSATSMFGVLNKGNIVILEGMHRCISIARAQQMHMPIHTNLTIALADTGNEDLPVIGGWKKTIS